MPSQKDDREWARAWALATELPFHIIVPTAVGYFADDCYETKPWFLITGVFLGMASLIYRVVRMNFDQDKKK